jgi:CBS domain-containing protein
VQDLLSEVTTASPDTKVSEAATTMAREDFSCLPVYDHSGQFVGAIDSDSVRRWTGSHLTDAGNIEDISVGRLLSGSGPMIASRRTDSPQRDIVASFQEALRREAPLVAVPPTSDGTRTGRLRGIITPWDVPSLYA